VNLKHSSTARRTGALLLLTVVAAGACGTDKNDSSTGASSTSQATQQVACAAGASSGAGSTFVANLAQQWIKDFAARCPGATINYQGVGSGAGIQQLTSGTVDFAGSDVAMKDSEQTAAEAKNGKVLTIPWTAGGIAIETNVSGAKDLKLTGETLAGIFAGKIKKWDDPAIKADNTSASLPSEGIQVIHRSDGSGTTAAFTAYLAAVAPSTWTVGAGKDVPWPTGQGAKGSDGVTAAVKQTEGAIGYAEVSFAKASGLGMAQVKNEAGKFVSPTADAVSAALKDATVPADLKVAINYKATDPAAYPISTTTFVLVPQKPADAARGKVVKDFILYAIGQGQAAAPGLDYAPLPSSLLDQAKAAAESIQA
jgi:phosphate transport system substrate-binding protein